MGCAVTMAETERERETVFTEMTADWSAASEGPQGASVLLRGYRVLADHGHGQT